MDVVARAVAFIKMLIAAKVKQVEFIDQAVPLEHVHGAINGDTVNAGIEFLGPFENCPDVEVGLGVVHDFDQDFSLAGEADTVLLKSGLQAAGAGMGIDSFAGGDSMWCSGHRGLIKDIAPGFILTRLGLSEKSSFVRSPGKIRTRFASKPAPL